MIGIPLMCLYPLLWVKNMNFWYYLCTYIMFEIVYTGVMIPYNTLPVEMTSDFAQRTYLAGSKAMFGKIANFFGSRSSRSVYRNLRTGFSDTIFLYRTYLWSNPDCFYDSSVF